jgi:hypothetical protein
VLAACLTWLSRLVEGQVSEALAAFCLLGIPMAATVQTPWSGYVVYPQAEDTGLIFFIGACSALTAALLCFIVIDPFLDNSWKEASDGEGTSFASTPAR